MASAFTHARTDGTITTELDDNSAGSIHPQSSTTAFSLSDSAGGGYSSQSVSASYGALHLASNQNVPIIEPGGAQASVSESATSQASYTIHLASGSGGVARFIFHLAGTLTGGNEGQGFFRVRYAARVESNGTSDLLNVSADLNSAGLTGPQPSDVGSYPLNISFRTDEPFVVNQSLSSDNNTTSTNSEATPPGGARSATDITLSNGGFSVTDTTGSPLDFTAESRSGSARGSNIPAGGSYAGFSLTNNAPGQLGTVVELLGGTAGSATQVSAAFTAPPTTTTTLVSDAVELNGTNNDPVVIQMHYNAAAAQAGFGTLIDLELAFFRRSDGKWVNAVLGNSGANLPTFFNRAYNPATDFHLGYVGNDTANGVVWAVVNHNTLFAVTSQSQLHQPFFDGEAALGNGVYYLQFPDGTPFGYYSYLSDRRYIYHFDLGYLYIFDAGDSHSGVYFYDFGTPRGSLGFFYTSPGFPWPYLYDFNLNAFLYCFPDNGRGNGYYFTNPRIFSRLDNGRVLFY